MRGERDGLILLDKPSGRTSFDTLSVVKRALGTGKVGHAGTLDKFARGLLLVLTGRLTRLVPFLMNLDKEYLAIVRFGTETDTLDPEGEVVCSAAVPSEAVIRETLPGFVGVIEQVPPVYSAVHHRGKRAYQLVRSGERPDLEARNVRIEDILVLSFDPPDLVVRVRCSKGTYIRALARDVGRACDSCASLVSLERTRIGPFSVDDAVTPERFRPDRDLEDSAAFIRKLPAIDAKSVLPGSVDGIRHGRPVDDQIFEEPPREDGSFALFTPGGKFAALVERSGGRYRYLGVFV